MSDCPNPLTHVDCNLQDFAFMPLDVARLRDSDLAANESPEACWAAVQLWAASWHQVPAASIPDDDKWMAQKTGYGRIIKEWMKVRAGALRGFVKCSDGRLYHPVVAEKAREAWQAKLEQRYRTECARIKKHHDRHGTKAEKMDFSEWVSLGCPQGQPLSVPSSKSGCPSSVPRDKPDCPQIVPRETPSKGQGEGQGQGDFVLKNGQFEIPEDWKPDAAGLLAAAGLDLAAELLAFRSHHVAKGSARADWQAAWQSWIATGRKFGKAVPGRVPVQVSGVWHESATGVDRMAAELGLSPCGSLESRPAFKARVLAAAGMPSVPMGMGLQQLAAMASVRQQQEVKA